MAQQVSVKVADINVSASGDNTIIAAVTGRPIIIHQIFLVANAAVNVIFKDGASTSLNAFAVPLIAQGSSVTLQYTGCPWFKASVGNAFIVNLSGAVQITGQIYYTLG